MSIPIIIKHAAVTIQYGSDHADGKSPNGQSEFSIERRPWYRSKRAPLHTLYSEDIRRISPEAAQMFMDYKTKGVKGEGLTEGLNTGASTIIGYRSTAPLFFGKKKFNEAVASNPKKTFLISSDDPYNAEGVAIASIHDKATKGRDMSEFNASVNKRFPGPASFLHRG